MAEIFTSGAKLVVEYVSIGYKASVIVLLHFKHKKIFYNPANSKILITGAKNHLYGSKFHQWRRISSRLGWCRLKNIAISGMEF